MSRMTSIPTAVALSLLAVAALQSRIALAQEQRTALEAAALLPPALTAQLEPRLAELERLVNDAIGESEKVGESEWPAVLELLRSRGVVREPVHTQLGPPIARATGSVTASARCEQGYVVGGSHRASAADVEIVAEQQIDCDDSGCRAFQATARREHEDPFDLEVSVICTS